MKKEIKVNEYYYFNNGRVQILKVENDDFVLVCGNFEIHTEVDGSQFCQMCMIGGMARHTCGDVDEIIEEVVEDLSDKNIFWVNVKHLQDKPFEFVKWEKITAENGEILKALATLKKQKLEVIESTKEIELQRESFLKEVVELEDKKQSILNSIEENKLIKVKIIADKDGIITLNSSNVKLHINTILEYIKSSVTLSYLEKGGVDNWEWYGESLPNEEVINNEALEELFGLAR